MSPVLKETLEWFFCFVIAIVLAMLFRVYIGTPTIVKQISMNPTLIEEERLWLNRWGRTTGKLPKRGDIITFEEPSKIRYTSSEIDLQNPIAKYDKKGPWESFVKDFLEHGKRSYIK